MTVSSTDSQNSIPESVRRDIIDFLRIHHVAWAGRLEETDFLSRLYRIDELPSHDRRLRTMAQDIRQHRVHNPMDWDDDWVYKDSRLNLHGCSDEEFLSFLCEMLHPIVRPDPEEVEALAEFFNECLARSGWQLTPEGQLAGRPVYSAQQFMPSAIVAFESANAPSGGLSAEYVMRQVTRMQSSIQSDPELAVGTAKEFVETICKTVLDELNKPYGTRATLLDLVKAVRSELGLLPEGIDDKAKGSAIVKRILGSLGSAAQGVAELRGLYGTGHGRSARSGGIQPRHARLAVGAATTLGVFLFETYQERIRSEGA